MKVRFEGTLLSLYGPETKEGNKRKRRLGLVVQSGEMHPVYVSFSADQLPETEKVFKASGRVFAGKDGKMVVLVDDILK